MDRVADDQIRGFRTDNAHMKWFFLIVAAVFVSFCGAVTLQVPQEQKVKPRPGTAPERKSGATLKALPDGLIPLNRQRTVLVDRKRKRVLLKTKVCNREALLEMLVCLTERKLHESILVLDANALEVHSGLLAIGAKPGGPAKFVPRYIPSHGQEIDIFLNWTDKDGRRQRCRAQEWIRNSVNRYHIQDLAALPPTVKVPFDELRYDTRRKELLWFGPMSQTQYESLCELSDDKAYRKAIDAFREDGRMRKMEAKFMFAGSFFYEDETTKRFYTAEAGYVVCVANLPEALIDVNVASSDSNGNLSYEASTDVIPPEETEVTVELIPVPGSMLNAKAAAAAAARQDKSDATKPDESSEEAEAAKSGSDKSQLQPEATKRQTSGGA